MQNERRRSVRVAIGLAVGAVAASVGFVAGAGGLGQYYPNGHCAWSHACNYDPCEPGNDGQACNTCNGTATWVFCSNTGGTGCTGNVVQGGCGDSRNGTCSYVTHDCVTVPPDYPDRCDQRTCS
jgi:hypothetical protein